MREEEVRPRRRRVVAGRQGAGRRVVVLLAAGRREAERHKYVTTWRGATTDEARDDGYYLPLQDRWRKIVLILGTRRRVLVDLGTLSNKEASKHIRITNIYIKLSVLLQD